MANPPLSLFCGAVDSRDPGDPSAATVAKQQLMRNHGVSTSVRESKYRRRAAHNACVRQNLYLSRRKYEFGLSLGKDHRLSGKRHGLRRDPCNWAYLVRHWRGGGPDRKRRCLRSCGANLSVTGLANKTGQTIAGLCGRTPRRVVEAPPVRIADVIQRLEG
jgi:hypothetical protein